MKSTYLTESAKETQRVAEDIAKELLKEKKGALVIGLKGNLGAGKTTFIQGFAKGAKIKDKILSPTFVILKRFGNFYHIDCYRIKSENDLLELGFKEVVSNPKSIVLIEWPERIKKIMPEKALIINFEFIDECKRKITVKN